MKMTAKLGALRTIGGGYTIIEVMIFLIVTGTLLVSALAVFNGRQVRTEFVQGVRETDQQIATIINEVATGYFPNAGGFTCTAGSPTVIDTGDSEEQGTNQDCIFVGKALLFGIGGETENYNAYVVAGTRLDAGGNIVTNLDDANPNLVPPLTKQYRVAYSNDIYRIVTPGVCAAEGNQAGAFSIYQSFGQVSDGDPVSGSQSIGLYAICDTTIGMVEGLFQTALIDVTNTEPATEGIILCFGDPNGRTAAVQIGGQSREVATDVFIDNDTPAECL